MNHADAVIFAREISPVIRRLVDDAVRPIADRLAALEVRPLAKDGVGVRSVVRDHLGCVILTLTDGSLLNVGRIKDGQDGKDGKDAEPENVAELVKSEIEPRLEALESHIRSLEVAQPPNGGDREFPDEEKIKELVAAEVAQIPRPKDGAAGKDGRDGVGLAGAMIDREGQLVATLTDGSNVMLGPVVGKDGERGADGFGLDDLTFEHDGERGLIVRFVRGDLVKRLAITLPGFVDRGVWRAGEYAKGDVVTWGGSLFIAQKTTTEKPEDGKDWRLAVKRGRDGKSGKDGERGAPGEKGDPGRDGYH